MDTCMGTSLLKLFKDKRWTSGFTGPLPLHRNFEQTRPMTYPGYRVMCHRLFFNQEEHSSLNPRHAPSP